MAVELTGGTLTIEEVLRVARGRDEVTIARDAVERMGARRAVVEQAVASGAAVYGVTTGVGMRREATIEPDDVRAFNRAVIAGHRVGLGSLAPDEVVRAALLRMANGLVAAHQGARPEVALTLVGTLNESAAPPVRSLGSVGQADLAQNADLAHGALDGIDLEAGEAGALLVSNAYSTGEAVLAVADTRAFVEWLDLASALDLEAFRGNLDAIHPEIGKARPYPGIEETLVRLQTVLAGGALHEPGAARFLQDPLTFRCVPQVHGALRDALRFAEEQVGIELNAHQGNPLIVPDEGRLVSVGNFDSLPLATALDLLRIALAPALASAVERTLKILSPRFSGLTEGLVPREGSWEDGLSELGVAAQAIAAEARLLAQPVSFELVSTMQESGVEDRAALASLAARRLNEMLALGRRVVAVELVVAAQAIDLRGPLVLGIGTTKVHAHVREHVRFLDGPDGMPLPLERLAATLMAPPPA